MSQEMGDFGNLLDGTNNKIKGKNNVIIGNFSKIAGNNNWIFISDFKGNVSDNLILSKWRIELSNSEIILINPRLVISFLD